MEQSTRNKFLKELIGAFIFNILIELWIFIDIAYSIKWSICVFTLASVGVTIFSVKAQRMKKCIFNSIIFAIMCIIMWLLIDLMKSNFNFYNKIFSFELGAGDGFLMITIYMYSAIVLISGTIISILISWWHQKHMDLKIRKQ